MKDIEQGLKDSVNLLLEQFKDAKAGSDEQKAIVDGVVKLSDERLKYIKGEDEIFNNDAERQKLYAEVDKIKAEIRKTEEDHKPNDLKAWAMQMRPDQIVNDAIIIMALIATVRMEKNGFILPERLTKWGMKLFGK